MLRVPILQLALAALLLAHLSCDEVESTLGGSPGGDPVLLRDTLQVTRMLDFARPQQMFGAAYQSVGRIDSLGLESVVLFEVEYTPSSLWSPQPDSIWVDLSFKMSNDTLAYWFPNDGNPPAGYPTGSRNIIDLDLLSVDPLDVEYDDLSWQTVFSREDGSLNLPLLDSLSFRVNDDDVVYGDDDNPLEGRRTYRRIPANWFANADTTSRLLMLRVADGQDGVVQMLSAGWTSELRPGVVFHEIRYDTLEENGQTIVDVVRDSSFVVCSWQSSVIFDGGLESMHSISSGYAGQVMMEFEPLLGPDASELLDPLTASFSDASLLLPLGSQSFNLSGAKLNAYTLSSFDSLGVDVESWQLVASTVLAAGDTLAELNLISHLRQIWVEEDSFVAADPIQLALKLDDFSLLRLRKLTLNPLDHANAPRMRFILTGAPEEWRP